MQVYTNNQILFRSCLTFIRQLSSGSVALASVMAVKEFVITKALYPQNNGQIMYVLEEGYFPLLVLSFILMGGQEILHD
jgi:hypothetical protein